MVAWGSSTNSPCCGVFFPILSGCFFTANSYTLHESTLHAYYPASSPPPHQETHDSGWGAQSCNINHVYRSYSDLSVTAFPSNPPKLPPYPRWFPHCEGDSLSVESTPLFQLPLPRVLVLSYFLFSFFSSFLSYYQVSWGFFLTF